MFSDLYYLQFSMWLNVIDSTYVVKRTSTAD